MKKGSLILRIFLYASLVSLVWLGGYLVLSEVFAVKEIAREEAPQTVTPSMNLPVPASSQWSALVIVDEEREVKRFLFRYADFLSDTMVFVDVPVTTKVELAAGGHEVLSVHNPELPEIFMISDLCRIFSETTWCMAAEEAGEALLSLRPKECYVMEEAAFEKMTEKADGTIKFKEFASVKEAIAEATEHSVTNDTMRDEMMYWESYQDIKKIYYRILPGKALAEEYEPDRFAVQEMVAAFKAGDFTEEENMR